MELRSPIFRRAVVAALALMSLAFGAAWAADAATPEQRPCKVHEGYIKVPGGNVYYKIVGDGPGTPLLTLHGGPGMAHDYLEPLAGLCHERPVIFYDQLGCGKSDRPHNKRLWRNRRFVRELAQVRRALWLSKVHILGQSWGTMLLTDYMLTEPEGVVSVIFSNPAISIPRFVADAARYRRELPVAVRETLERHEANGTTDCPEYQAAVLAYYKRHVCRLDPWPEEIERSFAGIGTEVYETMNGPNEFSVIGNIKNYDRTAELHLIDAPALFLAGRYDETSPEATAYYHSLMPGSEMVIFEKSAHMPMLEERDRYLQVVSDFLNRQEQPELAQQRGP